MSHKPESVRPILGPAFMVGFSVLLLVAGYGGLERLIHALNRIPNATDEKALVLLETWIWISIAGLAILCAMWWRSNEVSVSRAGRIGIGVLLASLLLSGTPVPLSYLGEAACAIAAAIFAALALRLPIVALRAAIGIRPMQGVPNSAQTELDDEPDETGSERVAKVHGFQVTSACMAAIGFAALALLFGKQTAMCFQID